MSRRSNRTLIHKYMVDNGYCEAFPRFWMNWPHPHRRLGCVRPSLHDAVDVHHIFGGHGRKDLVSNIICACRPFHDWAHRNQDIARVLCLAVKHHKGELDWSELDQCSGRKTRGWLESLALNGEWNDMRDRILE